MPLSLPKPYRNATMFGVLVGILVLMVDGVGSLLPYLVLVGLEAGIGSKNVPSKAAILATMDEKGKKRYRSWMFIFAIGGRFLLLILVTCYVTSVGFSDVIHMALQNSMGYAGHLRFAHPRTMMLIAGYMLPSFFNFALNEHKPLWLSRWESRLTKANRVPFLGMIITGIIVLLVSLTKGDSSLVPSGFIGIGAYGVTTLILVIFDTQNDKYVSRMMTGSIGGPRTGFSGLLTLLYLEAQSFGVVICSLGCAFVVSNQPLVIMGGFAVGMLFVRAQTDHFPNKGERVVYNHLKHGVWWAVGSIALLVFASLFIDIPGSIIGLVGIVFICASLRSGKRYNRLHPTPPAAAPTTP
jgi:hypothetical protein